MGKDKLKILVLLCFLSTLVVSTGWSEIMPYGQSDGYIKDTKPEMYLRYYEIHSFPKPIKNVDYYKLIFKQDLSQEYQTRYKEKFGQSESEQIYNQVNHFTEVEISQGVYRSIEDDSEEQREFGTYMVKRLGEYHVDEFTKTSPQLKPIYELKEKISKVNVEVRQGYKVKINYSFSGNYLNLKMENPYKIDVLYTLQMKTDSFGPASKTEETVSLGYDLNKKVRLSSQYKIVDGVVALTTTRKLNPEMTADVSGSTYVHKNGASQRESRLLLGFSWVH